MFKRLRKLLNKKPSTKLHDIGEVVDLQPTTYDPRCHSGRHKYSGGDRCKRCNAMRYEDV